MLLKPGTFICFQGILGAGKTLTMTRLGALAYLSGQQVCANYSCVFAKPIDGLRDLFAIRDSVLLLDELQSLLDSRTFQKNVDVTQWILITRKLGLSICYTTQFLGQVDIRVRHVTEYVYCCERATVYGCPGTKCTVLRWYGEAGTIRRTFAYAHTPQQYALYDTTDYRVRLTADGRVASFDDTQALAKADEASRKQPPSASQAPHLSSGDTARPLPPGRRSSL